MAAVRKTAKRATKKVAAKGKKTKRATAKKAAVNKKAGKKTTKTAARRWSQNVTEHSDAMDLKGGVFKQTDAKKIAASLKRSAEQSSRRKAGAYQSASSMLTFYINRAGKGLSKTEHSRLERAKTELKRLFHREDD